MKRNNRRKTLRTRPESKDITELLYIANRLPRELGADHESVVNSQEHGYDQKTLEFFLLRALAELPIDLKAFVTQSLELKLEKSGEFSLKLDEGLQKTVGPNLLQYAFDVARPLWGAGEIESMRQRYIFLFAVRDILRCLASPRTPTQVEPKEKPLVLANTRSWLRAAQMSFLNPAQRMYSKIDGLRTQLYISKEITREGTHKLAVYHPLLFQVLESVEAERIRECPVCGRLFWAGRLDQSACHLHGNVLRARRLREKRRNQKQQEHRVLSAPKVRDRPAIKGERKASRQVHKRKPTKGKKGR
jgi:hypothetical protein